MLCVDVKSGGQLWPGWRGRPAQPSPGPSWPGWALTTTMVVTVVTMVMVMVMVVVMVMVMVVMQHVRCQRCAAPLPGPRTPHTATARTCAASCTRRLLTWDTQTVGLGSVSSLVSSTQCCSAIVHCGKCLGVGWCKSVVPVSGELLRQLWLVCGGAATAASPARRSSALSCTAHSHGSGGAQCTVCSGHLAGGQGAHHQAGHHLQGEGDGGGQGASEAVSSEQQQAAVACWLLLPGLCWAWPVCPALGQDRG